FCVFFFFQAEDGIRDFHVTGVQTCALPISARVHDRRRRLPSLRRARPRSPRATPALRRHARRRRTERVRPVRGGGEARDRGAVRSEERRVGKEWRARRWAYVVAKKQCGCRW